MQELRHSTQETQMGYLEILTMAFAFNLIHIAVTGEPFMITIGGKYEETCIIIFTMYFFDGM